MDRSQVKTFVSDGCTSSWAGFYNILCDACRDHDQIYFLGAKSGLTRLQTDLHLFDHCMATAYSPKLTCLQKSLIRAYAPVQFAGVRVFGQVRFGPGSKWGYGDVY